MEQESGANNDDARKKRDSRSSPTPKDKAKKFRTTLAEENNSNNDNKFQSSAAVADDLLSSPVAEQGKTPKQPEHPEHPEQKKHATPTTSQIGDKQETTPTNAAATENEPSRLLDLETALHRLIGDENSTKEYLTETTTVDMKDRDYITFRWAHAGDAAKIAAWYRSESNDDISSSSSKNVNNKTSSTNTTNSKKKNEGEDDSQLELWLSDGLGDEDHPPFLFALLAHVMVSSPVASSINTSTKTPKLAACALLTLAWEEGKRLLRVEWRHVDTSLSHADLISRRLWLRLSSLALMSACTLAIEKDGTRKRDTLTDSTPTNLNNKTVALE